VDRQIKIPSDVYGDILNKCLGVSLIAWLEIWLAYCFQDKKVILLIENSEGLQMR
jgi:hypothetical protein